jgi:hypothetical protein
MRAGRCRGAGAGAHSEGGPERKALVHLRGAISVSLEGRRATAGLLLFHRAIRRLHAALFPGTVIRGYARFTHCGVLKPDQAAHWRLTTIRE